MKAGIHPEYKQITVTCSCGNSFETGSTMCKDLHVNVCYNCHPFYTGKQKIVDTAGRVDKFEKRFAGFSMGSTDTNKEATKEDILKTETK